VFDLSGKVAVVTGAASGIGAAAAVALASQGAVVIGSWFEGDTHSPDTVSATIASAGGVFDSRACDVRHASDVDDLITGTADRHGGVDIVVTCAGVTETRVASELSDEDFLRVVDIDLLGTFRCFRAAIPYMERRNWGRLIAISSIAGPVQGWRQHAHYSSAKAGVGGLVKALALELGPSGITVNAVAPGVVVSPQTLDPINSLGADELERFASRVPIKRNGQPEDIAAMFCYLASIEASFVTGQTFVVDGGLSVDLA